MRTHTLLIALLVALPSAASTRAEQAAFVALAGTDAAARVLTPAGCDSLAAAYESRGEPADVKAAALKLLNVAPCARPQVTRLGALATKPREADLLVRTLSAELATDGVTALHVFLETDRLLRENAEKSPLRAVMAWSALRGHAARHCSLAHDALDTMTQPRTRSAAITGVVTQAFAQVDPVTVSAQLERSVHAGFVTNDEREAMEDYFAANAHHKWHWVALARRGAATAGQVAIPPNSLDLSGFLNRALGSAPAPKVLRKRA